MFGKRSADRPAGGNFERFIKTFRDKRTVVTMLEPAPKTEWLEFREHFDHLLKMPGARFSGVSYPCAKHEGAPSCIGCDYPVEHPEWTDEFLKSDEGKALFGDSLTGAKDTRRKKDPGWGIRQASGKWIMKCLVVPEGKSADQAYVELYKIGFKLWEHLIECETTWPTEEMGNLTDQQVVIMRTGEDFNTTAYSALPTRKPPFTTERDIPTNAEIGDILGKKYTEAFEAYVEAGLTNEDGTPTGAPAPAVGEESQDPGGAGDEAQTEAVQTPASDAAKGRAADKQLPKGLEGLDIPEGWDPFLDARTASIGEMKDWLDNDPRGKHEYPARPPRPDLIKLIEKAQVPF